MKKQLESEIHSEWNDDAIQRKTENDAWFIFRTVFFTSTSLLKQKTIHVGLNKQQVNSPLNSPYNF